jgi:hypothetical protein
LSKKRGRAVGQGFCHNPPRYVDVTKSETPVPTPLKYM